MAPVVRISDETFEMLQQVALPLVDTADSAIRKALEVYLDVEGKKHTVEKIEMPCRDLLSSTKIFPPDKPPNLTHTSFINGQVGDTKVSKWNHLLLAAHVQAFKKLGMNLGALQKVSESNIREGEIEEGGFKPASGYGFSVQSVEANKAWATSYHLAAKFGFPISAEFRWQMKDKAAFPGSVARMSWKP